MYKINWITSPKDNEIELFSSHKALLQTKSPMLFIGGIHNDIDIINQGDIAMPYFQFISYLRIHTHKPELKIVKCFVNI